MDYINVILTGLTIITGALTVATFYNGRKNSSKREGEHTGALKSDLKYIKDVLLDVRAETKEINKLLDGHAIEIAKAQESIKSAHNRIDDAFNRIERLEKLGGLK